MSCEINEAGFDSCNNSLRLSHEQVEKYNLRSGVVVEDLSCGILLKPLNPHKLGWKETSAQMAAGSGEFSRWQDIDDAEYVHSLPVKRLDIFQALVSPTQQGCNGAEIPVVIISNDILNESLATVMACPLTVNLHPQWRCRVGIVCAGREMEVAVEQMRMIHKSRLLYKLDTAGMETGHEIAVAMSQMYCETSEHAETQIKFSDVLHLADKDIQQVLRELDHKKLSLALVNADEQIQCAYLKNMSERAAELVREETEFMGPVREADVEQARIDLCKVMRSLVDQGEISFTR